MADHMSDVTECDRLLNAGETAVFSGAGLQGPDKHADPEGDVT
jgi:hypothetical protein